MVIKGMNKQAPGQFSKNSRHEATTDEKPANCPKKTTPIYQLPKNKKPGMISGPF
jgi:hypothetical protein